MHKVVIPMYNSFEILFVAISVISSKLAKGVSKNLRNLRALREIYKKAINSSNILNHIVGSFNPFDKRRAESIVLHLI